MLSLLVECRSDTDRGPLPVRFGWPGRMREVAETLDLWEGEDHRYFRVRTPDGAQYILRQDLGAGSWQLHFYRRGAP